jgi:hypothetical protein
MSDSGSNSGSGEIDWEFQEFLEGLPPAFPTVYEDGKYAIAGAPYDLALDNLYPEEYRKYREEQNQERNDKNVNVNANVNVRNLYNNRVNSAKENQIKNDVEKIGDINRDLYNLYRDALLLKFDIETLKGKESQGTSGTHNEKEKELENLVEHELIPAIQKANQQIPDIVNRVNKNRSNIPSRILENVTTIMENWLYSLEKYYDQDNKEYLQPVSPEEISEKLKNGDDFFAHMKNIQVS